MPITHSELAKQAGEAVADMDLDVGERLALAKDLVEGVLVELADNHNVVTCVGEGMLKVAAQAIDNAIPMVD